MSLESLREKTLSGLVELNKDESIGLTGEKNLEIFEDEFEAKVKKINPGYLEVLATESAIFVGQGLIKGRRDASKIILEIPDWDKFISAVNAFYIACYAPQSEEDEE